MKNEFMVKALRLTALLLTTHGSLLTTASAATPGFDTLVNYDTAWTYVYDGGNNKNGLAINDKFNDIKCLTNGVCVCRAIGRHFFHCSANNMFEIRWVG